jgi:hypothetical protein
MTQRQQDRQSSAGQYQQNRDNEASSLQQNRDNEVNNFQQTRVNQINAMQQNYHGHWGGYYNDWICGAVPTVMNGNSLPPVLEIPPSGPSGFRARDSHGVRGSVATRRRTP